MATGTQAQPKDSLTEMYEKKSTPIFLPTPMYEEKGKHRRAKALDNMVKKREKVGQLMATRFHGDEAEQIWHVFHNLHKIQNAKFWCEFFSSVQAYDILAHCAAIASIVFGWEGNRWFDIVTGMYKFGRVPLWEVVT